MIHLGDAGWRGRGAGNTAEFRGFERYLIKRATLLAHERCEGTLRQKSREGCRIATFPDSGAAAARVAIRTSAVERITFHCFHLG